MTKFDDALASIEECVENVQIQNDLTDQEIRDILDIIQGQYK